MAVSSICQPGADGGQSMSRDGGEVGAVAQRGQGDVDGREAVVEIGAEAALGDCVVKRGICCRDQENVDLAWASSADRADGPVIQQAQENGLQRQFHVADFVQKQRAAICLSHQSGCAAAACAGEGAFGVTE